MRELWILRYRGRFYLNPRLEKKVCGIDLTPQNLKMFPLTFLCILKTKVKFLIYIWLSVSQLSPPRETVRSDLLRHSNHRSWAITLQDFEDWARWEASNVTDWIRWEASNVTDWSVERLQMSQIGSGERLQMSQIWSVERLQMSQIGSGERLQMSQVGSVERYGSVSRIESWIFRKSSSFGLTSVGFKCHSTRGLQMSRFDHLADTDFQDSNFFIKEIWTKSQREHF